MTTTPEQRPWRQYWTPIAQQRTFLKSLGERLETPHEFHVLGAGVTGLAAAIEILELPLPRGQRHRVVIYEGSERVGGRINTKRLGKPPEPGRPDTRPYFERGAMRIPTSHDYTWAYVQEAKLERRRFLNDDRSHDFQKSSQVYRPTQLAKLEADYELLQEDRGKGPGLLFATHVLEPEMTRLDAAYRGQDVWAPMILEGRIEGNALQRIDALTLGEVLEQCVGSRGKLKEFLQDLLFAGLSDRSFLMFVRSWLVNRGDLYELCRDHGNGIVVGGMDLLVDAMRARIEAIDENVIQCQRPVTEIAIQGANWTVRFRDGKTISRNGERRRHLLCTLPFSILRDGSSFRLSGFSQEKIAAIQGLSYAHATKVAVHVTERFWENKPFEIKGGRSLNDRQIRATYYPNDGNKPESIGEANETHAPYDLYTQPLRTQTEAEVATRAAEPPQAGPWLMLSSYTFGEHAEEMGRKPPGATLENLRRVFPDVDKYVAQGGESESETWYWNQKEWAKGPFVLPAPGIVGKFFQTARRPEGRIFFAGDHLSPEPGWIQGSLFSSLRALQQILQSAVGVEDSEENVEDLEDAAV